MSGTLPIIWSGILLLEIALYVILDGADLGIGVLSLFAKNEKQRSTMMKSIGPIWDANETWLVIAGGTLFGAFPIAYGIILNALQIPIMLMVFGLIFRAVSFEFREHSDNKHFWSMAFAVGSIIAILGQGFILGGLFSGIKVINGAFAGSPLGWFNPLSILFGLGVALGYTMLGYSFLIRKTKGKLERQEYHQLRIASSIAFAMSIATTILLPFTHDFILNKWSNAASRNILLLFVFLAFTNFILLLRSTTEGKHENTPYTYSIVLFIITLATLLYAVYPYMIPPTTTIFEAASGSSTLSFMLFGISILIPVVLFYNVFVHKLFDGKVDRKGGYL